MSTFSFLLAPFIASLILTGIHAYLGVHVVERGVIFVDLSLAQIAAFGATVAMLTPLAGGDPHAPGVYWISLVFTFLGAFVFSTIRSRRARIPHDPAVCARRIPRDSEYHRYHAQLSECLHHQLRIADHAPIE